MTAQDPVNEVLGSKGECLGTHPFLVIRGNGEEELRTDQPSVINAVTNQKVAIKVAHPTQNTVAVNHNPVPNGRLPLVVDWEVG